MPRPRSVAAGDGCRNTSAVLALRQALHLVRHWDRQLPRNGTRDGDTHEPTGRTARTTPGGDGDPPDSHRRTTRDGQLLLPVERLADHTGRTEPAPLRQRARGRERIERLIAGCRHIPGPSARAGFDRLAHHRLPCPRVRARSCGVARSHGTLRRRPAASSAIRAHGEDPAWRGEQRPAPGPRPIAHSRLPTAGAVHGERHRAHQSSSPGKQPRTAAGEPRPPRR